MKYWCLLDWGGTDIRALRRASHGSDIDYNIQLRSMACDKEEEIQRNGCYCLLLTKRNHMFGYFGCRIYQDFLWAIHLFHSDLTGTSANVDRS